MRCALAVLLIVPAGLWAFPAPKDQTPPAPSDVPPTEEQIAEAIKAYAKHGGKFVRSISAVNNRQLYGFAFPAQARPKLQGLPNLPFAFWLSFSNTGVTRGDLEELTGMPNLDKLELRRTALGDKGLNGLRNLRRLNSLDLSENSYTDDALSELPALALRSLNVGNTKVTGSGLNDLAKYGGLEELYLYGTPTTDKCLAQVGELKRLNRLSLTLTKITDKSGASLGKLKNLRHLDLCATAVTDEVLKEVRNLQDLDWLDLSQTGITDASVDDLKTLMKLRVLRLENTQVTADAVKRLRTALPGCRIDHPASRNP